MKKETKALLKIQKVIKSCETKAHILSTHRLLNNYMKLFEPKNSLTTEWYEFIMLTRELSDALTKRELEIRGMS